MDKNLLVHVLADAGGGKYRFGTAYPVAPNRLITAAHVIENATPDQIEVSWYHQTEDRGWKPCQSIVWNGEPDYDVVVLETEFPDAIRNRFGPLSQKAPKADTRWQSEGFPRVGQRDGDSSAIPLMGTVFSLGDHWE